MASHQRVAPGSPYPLGATWDGKGVNFALFSAHAEKVELCLFDDDGTETRHPLSEQTIGVWHGAVPGVAPDSPPASAWSSVSPWSELFFTA